MRPQSIEEAADLLAAAARDGRRVRIGTDLETDGLARVLEHEAGDLTCTVEAASDASSAPLPGVTCAVTAVTP